MPTPPYVSQWGALEANALRVLDGGNPSAIVDWAAQGFSSPGDYLSWSDRSCGVACLQSLLSAFSLPVPDKAGLIDELVGAGVYVVGAAQVTGLVYEPCVRWLRARWHLEATAHRTLDVREIERALAAGRLVIASVSPEIRWPRRPPTRRGGHLVLVYAARADGLVFHNPSGLPATRADGRTETARGAVLAPVHFDRFFARRGITVSTPGEAG